MVAYTKDVQVVSPLSEVGDDIYAKESGADWDGATWLNGVLTAEPVSGVALWDLPASGLDTDKSYILFLNVWRQAITADASTNTITCTAHGLAQGTRVYFRGGDLPAGIQAGTAYWIDTVTTNTFQLKTASDLSGSVVDITDAGSGSRTVTAVSKRSSADVLIGTIDQRVDLDAEVSLLSSLLQADDLLVENLGVWKLHKYAKGTTTDLVTPKTAKQPGGANLTDPTSQLLAGYQE